VARAALGRAPETDPYDPAPAVILLSRQGRSQSPPMPTAARLASSGQERLLEASCRRTSSRTLNGVSR
jgi:hypothetical protein